jgi:hypothetical protein
MQLADRWLRCRQLPLLRHEIQARQATPPLPLPCRDAPRRSARRRQSCRQRSTAEIALGGVEPPRAAVPPSSPGWRGSNAIRPIETTRVHDRFVKSFQYLLTDLHQFNILQSGRTRFFTNMALGLVCSKIAARLTIDAFFYSSNRRFLVNLTVPF